MPNQVYQRCTRCIMDSSTRAIVFDEAGVCNYCTEFLAQSGHILFKNSDQRQQELQRFVAQVKRHGRGKPYDCIVGVSGGVDSSISLVHAVTLGLRPLAVHMDNGWNSELAQNNIANLVRNLGVDLYTHVIDWHEYRQLMQAFFDADVIDVELLYDNAMSAVNYQQAAQYGIHYILAGTNHSSEGMRIPDAWNWFKLDKRNIEAIGQHFANMRLTTFPAIGILDYLWYRLVRRINWIDFLDFFDYNKFEAMELLQRDYAYKPYPYKHYESIFTRFYQGYILPEKFHVDKRILHFSTLIISGQMTREDALHNLQSIPYPSIQDLEEDRNYFLKKMLWSQEQLQAYLARPAKLHSEYPSERPLQQRIKDISEKISRTYTFFMKPKANKARP